MKTEKKTSQEMIDLYDEFTHSSLPRREFMTRLAKLAGGAVAAAAVLPLIAPNYSIQQVAPDDNNLVTERVTYPGASGEMRGYLARPADVDKAPGVLVIHENRGLNPHIEDVARRAALAGFIALAPDALSPLGGTPADSGQARQMFRDLDREKTVEDFVAGVDWLSRHEHCTGHVGCVGFCWGGGMSNQLAVHSPALKAAVVFYGRSPAAEDVPEIRAALLLNYAGLDRRINASIPDYEAALKQHGKEYTLHRYEGVNHAFHNDTSESRYDEAAAKLAWSRTVEFFRLKLR